MKDSKKKDSPLTFQYVNSASGKEGKTYTDDEDDGNLFHCDDPHTETVDGNPGESRLIDCYFNVRELGA